MKKAIPAAAAACFLVSSLALSAAASEPLSSKTMTQLEEGRLRTCPVPNGAAFVLTAGAPNLGKHDVHASGKIADAFASAFSVRFQSEHFVTALPSFADPRPECANYASSGNALFALSDHAVFRFMSANGKRGGSVLLVSRDGGRTFSDNIHPNALAKPQGNEAIHAAFQGFGYYKSRFRLEGEQYQVEITNPLNYVEFLLFVSSDRGKTWRGPISSKDPVIFARSEVEKWRDQSSSYQWIDKVFTATTEACNKRPGLGCAIETDNYWRAQWRECRQVHSGGECLNILPEPTPRFSTTGQGE